MKDLLKEAIADAKAVRETALANAKIALEEAFTPRLQSMLSAKLAEEMDDESDEHSGDGHDEMPDPSEKHDEHHMEDDGTDSMSDPKAMEEGDEWGERDGGDEPDHSMDDEHYETGMGGDEDDDLDLDEIIKELEMDEDLDSSEIGTGNNKVGDYDSADEEVTDDLFEEDEDMSTEMDEDVDINEIIRSLREEDEEGEDVPAETEEEPASSEDLEEAYNVIRFLKGKINEVNLLNAKLLYSNKLFRNFSLNEGQKMKVIENFDRAHSLREVKLVYSTLAEGFKMPSTKKIVKESFASKPIASTKPAKQVISEGADLAARFQKLAGLKK